MGTRNMFALVLMLLCLVPTFAFAGSFLDNASLAQETGVVKLTTTSTATSTPPAPQFAGLFRLVKPDGMTVIQQGGLNQVGSLTVLTVSPKDAFLTSGGKFAFNVKYDEISYVTMSGTTNRLFNNDTLVGVNSKIDLAAGVIKTIWTQLYFSLGQNTIRVVLNADGRSTNTGLIRVNVVDTAPVAGDPKFAGPFRFVKPDGQTVLAQGLLGQVASMTLLNLNAKDAFLTSNGKYAFNVKYDESAPANMNGTTNSLYDNDALVAVNSKIDLVAGVVKTVWTQIYLNPGLNTIRVVLNSAGKPTVTAWIRVYVSFPVPAPTTKK